MPERFSKAFEDTSNLDMGMGPIGSELGGLHITVEVARNKNLTFSKKFDIIYI